MKQKVIVSWSGGKDCAWSLFNLLKSQRYEVLALITNVEADERVKMQGIRISLLKKQADNLGIPLEMITVSTPSGNEEYESKTLRIIDRYREKGAEAIVFGDLFLEDIKNYRDELLERWNFQGLYPIWKHPTKAAAQEMIEEGFRGIVTCVDVTQLDQSFAGREFDQSFLDDLPPSVDPCGENGEFHTFVFSAPFFKEEIRFERGEFFFKNNRFYYCDLLPKEA